MSNTETFSEPETDIRQPVIEALRSLGFVRGSKYDEYVHPERDYTLTVSIGSSLGGPVQAQLSAYFPKVTSPGGKSWNARDLGFKCQDINVSLSRTPDALAKDIKRRLITPMDDQQPRYRETAKRHIDRDARNRESLDRLAHAFDGRKANGSEYAKGSVTNERLGERLYVKAEILGYETDYVRLQVDRLSIGEALRVVELVESFSR